MGAEQAISLIFSLIQTALGAAKNAGILGSPDWLKYAESGIFLAQRAATIVKDIFANPSKYDTMSAEQIKALLMPLTWDEIEAQARAELSATPVVVSPVSGG